MAGFTHIHCSSRFDRSAAALEADLDDWMSKSSLITVTEVQNDRHAVKLREKGWGYFNAKLEGGRDDCAIAWNTDVWKRVSTRVIRISNDTFNRGGPQYLYACEAVLVYRDTGHKTLIDVSHMPAHVEGQGGLGNRRDEPAAIWAARKAAYLSGLSKWSTHVKNAERKAHTDAAMIVGDWNVNLKDKWFRDLLHNHFGPDWRVAWMLLPKAGGALTGAGEPMGSMGKGDRIIDGSMLKDIKVSDGPQMMARVLSSDHRPFREELTFALKPHLSEAEKKAVRKEKFKDRQDDDLQGDIKHGDEWWGFGDYLVDEIYFTPGEEVLTGEAGGEVL